MSFNTYVMDFVNKIFASGQEVNHEIIAKEFHKKIKEITDNNFVHLLIVTGFIPDIYTHDSSEETLSTKLVEVIVAEWARRMGFKEEIIKEKSSREDINFTLESRVVVVDAKSFRLGRSQKAPNTKDFIKLEDIKKWMERYNGHAIGGMVVYPCQHEWSTSSDVYLYCSTKETPTVMLPYKYLAFILQNKENFETEDLLQLWNYDDIFPKKLAKKSEGGNKKLYWSSINNKIIEITNTSVGELIEFMDSADKLINDCVKEHRSIIKKIIEDITAKVQHEVENTSDQDVRAALLEYKTKKDTEEYLRILKNIKEFRGKSRT